MAMRDRIIVWFSCGAASAVAAKKTIELCGRSHNVQVVCCDTRLSEHEDNFRFSAECEAWFGQPITFIRNTAYTVVDDVFEKHRYMAGIGGAKCTTELKKIPRIEFAFPDDIHVFGFTIEEWRRAKKKFRDNNPELRLKWTLIELLATKEDCLRAITEAGIELPRMYQLGFNNNNCPGCVKASSPWYWVVGQFDFVKNFTIFDSDSCQVAWL